MSSNTPWSTGLLCLWALLCACYMSGFHPALLMLSLATMVAFGWRGRLPLNRWSVGLGTAGALLAAGVVWQSTKESGFLLGAGGVALVTFFALQLGLWTLLRPTEATRLALPGAATALLIACTLSLHLPVVAVIATGAVLLLALASRERVGLQNRVGPLVLPMLLMATLALTLATAASWSETKVSYLLNMFAVIPASGIRFPPTSSLSSLQQWGGSDIVVLRVYGDDAPPYLVGRTFTEFDTRNTWVWKPTKTEVSSTETITVAQGKSLPYYTNDRTAEKPPGASVLVEFPDGGSGFTFYTPRYFAGFATDLPQLHRYSDGMWQVLARDTFSGFYWLYPYSDGWEASGKVEPLSDKERIDCLRLPDHLTPEVARQAETVAGAYSDPAEKARRITAYFQTQFTYGYDYPFTSTQTALEEFLRERPPAHCEFFATAAALMLRSQGVPTRYINGFVVQERSFNNEYYVIRLKHAHAWVEVYLPDQGWVTFDPTPPGTLDDPDTRGPMLSAVMEWLSNRWRQLLGWFRLSPADMLASLKVLLSSLSPSQWLAAVGLLASLWGFLRWWRQRRHRPAPKSPGPVRYVAGRHPSLTPALERLQSAITPAEWRRRASETPAEWLARLRHSDLEPELLQSLARAIESYEAARYGHSCEANLAQSLEAELARLRGGLEGKSLEAREARES